MLRRIWIAATAAAAAALYLLHLVFRCNFRGERDKGQQQGHSTYSAQEQLLDEPAHAEEDDVEQNNARGPLLHDVPAHSSQQPHGTAAQCIAAEPRALPGDHSSPLLPSSEVTANGRSNGSAGEPKPAAAAPPPASGSQPVVDIGYLQGLLEDELGPPKFSVPKSPVAMQHEDSLKALLDKEFGPPKFAVQKRDSPSSSSSAMGLSSASDQETYRQERTSLLLTVTAGPAVGVTVQSTENQAEIGIGRLPDNTLPIVDQEVSGHHAVIQFDSQQDCWTVVDTGSLNGSVLNGTIISTSDRKPGKLHVLSDQDLLELGGITKIKVTCTTHAPHPSKRHAAANTWGSGGLASSARLPFHTSARLPALMHEAAYPDLQLQMAVHQVQGTDHVRTNTPIEDVVHFQCPFEPFGPQSGLLCLFDGHHGSQAAKKAKELLPAVVVDKLRGDSGGELITGRAQERQQQLLREVFLETDAQLASDEGCTATVVLLQRGPAGELQVQAANVGDSSTVVVNTTTGSWSKLTADHRIANSSSERQRLQARGHTVKKRLYGLNISRMLGDKFLKDEDLGFIAEPHISQVEALAAEHGGYVIVATDGLWDVLSEERAAQIVLKAHAEGAGSSSARLVADMLLSQAVLLRSGDDITILVVEKNPSAAEP